MLSDDDSVSTSSMEFTLPTFQEAIANGLINLTANSHGSFQQQTDQNVRIMITEVVVDGVVLPIPL